MEFSENYLDIILVPAGLLIFATYHLYLVYRLLRYPATTVIGYENISRMAWVENMMQVQSQTGLALSVISSNISGAIYLATITLTLGSLIGYLVGNSNGYLAKSIFIIGDTSSTTLALKYISMLFSFMLAFGSFVQCARYFIQADYFITTPTVEMPMNYVQESVIKANNFWQIGLRLLYLALAFLFWSFGPIPMFVSCVIMVVLLFFLDSNSTPVQHHQPVKKKKVVDV